MRPVGLRRGMPSVESSMNFWTSGGNQKMAVGMFTMTQMTAPWRFRTVGLLKSGWESFLRVMAPTALFSAGRGKSIIFTEINCGGIKVRSIRSEKRDRRENHSDQKHHPQIRNKERIDTESDARDHCPEPALLPPINKKSGANYSEHKRNHQSNRIKLHTTPV